MKFQRKPLKKAGKLGPLDEASGPQTEAVAKRCVSHRDEARLCGRIISAMHFARADANTRNQSYPLD